MALYEHIFLARQDVTQQQVEALTEQIKTEDRLARRRSHQGRALGAEVARVPHQEEPQGAFHAAEHRRALRGGRRDRAPLSINEDVIRYLTIRVDEHEAGPSAMLRKRDDGDRDDRGPRGPRGDRP